MSAQILDFHHSTGPAPAYAIESDSEEDEWADEPRQEAEEGRRRTKASGEGVERPLEWQPTVPDRMEFPGQSGLLVLVGDAGLLVGSGLPQHLRAPSQSTIQLDQFLLLFQPARFVLTPRHVPLHLQSALALKLLADIRPPRLTIISTYQAPTYIPASEHFLIRYLASSLSDPSSAGPHSLETIGCQHFNVPNLIKGFEAALMIQANILQIDSKMILLPAISIPHDDKSSTSIPVGQYDFSSASTGVDGSDSASLPASLLGLDDPAVRRTLGAVIDDVHLKHLRPTHGKGQHPNQDHWRFPLALEPALRDAFRKQLNLDQQLKPKPHPSAIRDHEIGLMYM